MFFADCTQLAPYTHKHASRANFGHTSLDQVTQWCSFLLVLDQGHCGSLVLPLALPFNSARFRRSSVHRIHCHVGIRTRDTITVTEMVASKEEEVEEEEVVGEEEYLS